MPLTLKDACTLLQRFNCLHPEPMEALELRSQLQQAVQVVAQHSDYQILGICAATLAQGIEALTAYTDVLGYSPTVNLTPLEGPVYIKFNPQTGLCYATAYSGEYRGVLVSCQSAEAEDVNDMFGHLPLNLFSP